VDLTSAAGVTAAYSHAKRQRLQGYQRHMATVTSSEARFSVPACKYGDHCYRRENNSHMLAFYHAAPGHTVEDAIDLSE
jgi:hypothetical protein